MSSLGNGPGPALGSLFNSLLRHDLAPPYTLVTVTPADKGVTKFDLLEGDRPILRGEVVTVIAALKEFAPP